MKHGVKIFLIIISILIILVGVTVVVYLNFGKKTVYHVIGVEKTEYTVADFAEKSELQFYNNGTFRIMIEHKEKGLSLTAIGTYQLDHQNYQLKFERLLARNTEGEIVNYTDSEESKAITCTRRDKTIIFVDHKAQTFYFG